MTRLAATTFQSWHFVFVANFLCNDSEIMLAPRVMVASISDREGQAKIESVVASHAYASSGAWPRLSSAVCAVAAPPQHSFLPVRHRASRSGRLHGNVGLPAAAEARGSTDAWIEEWAQAERR